MTRSFTDKTSTCVTCVFWDCQAPDLVPNTGYCGFASVPQWVRKHLAEREDHRIMQADEGLDCWQHSKRHTPECATQDSELGACTCDGQPADQSLT